MLLFNTAGSPDNKRLVIVVPFSIPYILHVLQLIFSPSFLFVTIMASTLGLLAAALTFFSSAIAFSPDQCNKTSHGAPSKAACTTLLTTISKLGVGNTSYLFIPENFPTPDGLSNGTRKDFPQTWKTSKSSAVCFRAPWAWEGSIDPFFA